MKKKVLGAAVLLIGLVGVASASEGWWRPTTSAPEIDPASAMAGLTMLLGGLAVLRGRRSKK
jgi:LPXTG-motif cell wall-anchored protein